MVNNVTARLNGFKEACRNEFVRISSEFNTSIKTLRNEMFQRYVITRRLQIDFDQLSVANQSEASTESSFGKKKKKSKFIDISLISN
jgi:hypothetical protein